MPCGGCPVLSCDHSPDVASMVRWSVCCECLVDPDGLLEAGNVAENMKYGASLFYQYNLLNCLGFFRMEFSLL